MHEVTAAARTGYLIVLDQCRRCGGVWCDRWELFPLTAAAAAALDPVDAAQLAAPNEAAAQPGQCPRCAIALRPFRDPLLPPDARIERCAVCEGMWLNRGELRRVKQRSASRPPLRDEVLEQLARSVGAEAKWAKVQDVGAALHAADHPDQEEPDNLRSALWSTGGWAALTWLLRFVLRI